MSRVPDDLYDSAEKAKELSVKILHFLDAEDSYSDGEELMALAHCLIASCLACGMELSHFNNLLVEMKEKFMFEKIKYEVK